MTESPVPIGSFSRLIRGCAWLLVGAICLTLAVELLRAIWPWLLGGVLVIMAIGAGWRMWSFMQHEKW